MTKRRVLITTAPYGRFSSALDELRAADFEPDDRLYVSGGKPSLTEIAAALMDADAVIAGTTEFYGEKLLSGAPRLRLVSRVGIGLDNIDFAACAARQVEVAYTPDAVSRGVSEFTLGLVIALARGIAFADRGLHRPNGGEWKRYVGPELDSRVVGVVGLGRIGKLVTPLFRALGMTVLANDIAPDHDFAGRHGVRFVEKDELFASSDIVTLHLPLTRLTRGLMNRETLGRMKRTAYLVNTSRGPVVSHDDLVTALMQGVIAGAALDVFDEEPYHGPLTRLENVLLTCHMGSCSDLARRRMEEESARNVIDFFAGKIPAGRVPDELRRDEA